MGSLPPDNKLDTPRHLDEKEIRATVKEILAGVYGPIVAAGKTTTYRPLTCAELLYAGAYFTRSMAQFGADPSESALYDSLLSCKDDPQRLEDTIVQRVLDGKESLDMLRKAQANAHKLLEDRRKYRKMAVSMFRDAIPPSTPGRDRLIEKEELQDLARQSQSLLPPILSFLEIRRQAPKSSALELIALLHKQYPEPCEFLKSHVSSLEAALRDLPKRMSLKARAHHLADVVAGDDWGLKPSYALKRAKEARRLLKRRSQSGQNSP